MSEEEFTSLLWSIYRRGAIHGGVIAVATATVWFVFI